MTIPIEFIALFLTAAIASFAGLVNYLRGEIKEIKESLNTITNQFSGLSGRMGQSETWQMQHERQDDERQEAMEREHLRIWAQLDHHHN